MQIESLQLFCDLVELKNFSRAAEKNFISQSAVSQQISQFETEFKCQLIDRRKRPFDLTEAGKIFYQGCKDITSKYNRCRSELSLLSIKPTEQTKISAIFSIGMHILQEYVKKFMSQYPSHTVDLDFASADKIYKDLLSGQIDIGIVAVPTNDKHLDIYEFLNEEMVLVCSPKHTFAGQDEIDIHLLSMQKFIALGKDVPTRSWLDGILKRYNVVTNTVMEFDNTETIKRAVEINSGISILPSSTVKAEKESGRLWVCHFSNETIVRPTGILVRKNRILSEPSKYLIELLTGKRVFFSEKNKI